MGHAVPRLETMRPLALLLAVACYFPAALAGQVVEGQVVDTITGQPIGNGFVVLLDGTGTEVARWLSGPGGRFSIRAPGPGRYRVRSERIGYRVTESTPFELVPGQTLTYLLQVSPLPIHLADIEARSRSTCRIDPEGGEDVFLLWGEIRKALTATVWGSRQRTFTYRKYNYERDLDKARRRLLREVGRTTEGRSSAPFRSRTASQLANEGYVIVQGDETWYYLPDANVLLEPAFVDTHCFRVSRDRREHPGQIGLAFAPVPGRSLPDIEGVLWLDERSAELGALEVRYTKLPDEVDDERIGGRVEFARLPSGAWIVRRWEINTPIVEIEERETRFLRRLRRVAFVVGFHDIGGEILSVVDRDGSQIYEAPLAWVEGTVFDSTTVGPLAGATVTIAGTNITALTDSAGAFRLAAPLDGEYPVAVSHPWLDSLGLLPPGTTVTLTRGRGVSLDFGVPHVNMLLDRLCGGDGFDPHDRVLLGRVRRGTGSAPVAKAKVHASWQVVRSRGVRLTVQRAERTVVADEAGRYVLCGLPAGRPVRVTANDGQRTSRTAHVLFPDAAEGMLAFEWDKVPGRAYTQFYQVPHPAWAVDLTLVRQLEERGDLPDSRGFTGVVTDSTSGEPIAAVQVSVNGREQTVTRLDGTFDIALDVPSADPDVVVFRRVGYRSVTREVRVDTDQPVVFLPVSLLPLAVELAEIVVEGELVVVSAKLKLSGFYERRKLGLGDFLAEEDIERLVATDVIAVVRSVPGINYIPPHGPNTVGRVGTIVFSRARCGPPAVYLDGLPFRAEDLLSVSTANVAAVELYNGPSEVPVEFKRTGSACGVIVIWTK